MAEFNEEKKVEGVFGGVDFGGANFGTSNAGGANGGLGLGDTGFEGNGTDVDGQSNNTTEGTIFTKVEAGSLPAKPSIWSKIRSFLFQEIDWTAPIKVELTPYQQKVEDEINEFLHQEISFKGFFNLVTGKK